uniref:valine--tRNA ligase n=1 Tax=Triticum urartu TaxID=4572 RepID=A0A8R7PDZ3_TRIUA
MKDYSGRFIHSRRYGSTITNQIKRLGASCDWTRECFTLDDQLSHAVVEAFIRLHEKGLIYQGSYLVNWSPNLQTAVSDLVCEEITSFLTSTYIHISAQLYNLNQKENWVILHGRSETSILHG